MLKYLKTLFHDIMSRSQQSVDQSARVSGELEMENETVTSSLVSPAPSKDNSASGVKSARNCRDVEIESRTRRCARCCCAKRICGEGECRRRKRASIAECEKSAGITSVENCPAVDSDGMCRCENCRIVTAFSECVVCLESLQTRGVRTCPVCSNIVCSACSEKLRHCPYCRSAEPMQKNRAIERLLAGLFLPCKNFRNGCRKMLNSETRSNHEIRCEHINCPISDVCCWNGSPSSILGHMRKAHGLKPLTDHGLTVEISSLREKTVTSQGEYTIYLSCYGQLFAVKVKLRRRKLTLSFSRLGYVTRNSRKLVEKKYGVWIKIKVSGKQFREVLPFDQLNRETCQVEINCVTLIHHNPNEDQRGDNLRIEISIREVEASCQ